MENSTASFGQVAKRNEVLNLLKGLACIAVVFIHIKFPGVVGIIFGSSLTHFAVPSFLMIAGYFAFGKDETVIKRRLIKILKIFAFGYLCFLGYNVLFQVLRGSVIEWLALNFKYTTPIKYAVFCTIDFAIPLWYLIAMAEAYFG
ncbi:acyltransferase family protein [uncultured Fibrobacter sp.]|uniref:acyltransferase family protein n=1 Tax=uncultured Fibrobacter sp. TaxID=261512 RepID=UPI0025F54737|nr:acyltransferase family protein [uncultured Fibrobacter sp.]